MPSSKKIIVFAGTPRRPATPGIPALGVVLEIPESGLAKARSGTHKLLLLAGASVPDGGKRLHNRQLVSGRLPAPFRGGFLWQQRSHGGNTAFCSRRPPKKNSAAPDLQSSFPLKIPRLGVYQNTKTLFLALKRRAGWIVNAFVRILQSNPHFQSSPNFFIKFPISADRHENKKSRHERSRAASGYPLPRAP